MNIERIEIGFTTCVIIGSFRKHFDQIKDVIMYFEDNNIIVLSPQNSNITTDSINDEFIILESDNIYGENKQIKYIESVVLDKIEQSSFIYLYNPGGYVGLSAAFEIGYAYRCSKDIFAAYDTTDVLISQFISSILSPYQMAQKAGELYGERCLSVNNNR